jgi:cob(I)alamin adenosyltransferase
MKIYTRTGDEGSTSLFGGSRVKKSELRIEAYGTVDELNAWIGWLRDLPVNKERQGLLIEIQDRLFTTGSMLAVEPGNTRVKVPALSATDIESLEKAIDQMDASLPAMRTFVLPGGHSSVSAGHVARTVCRRAERRVVALADEAGMDPLIIKYLNRLSDYLFVLCRSMARELGADETPWHPKT